MHGGTISPSEDICSLSGSLGCGRDDHATLISLFGKLCATILYMLITNERATLVGAVFFLSKVERILPRSFYPRTPVAGQDWPYQEGTLFVYKK